MKRIWTVFLAIVLLFSTSPIGAMRLTASAAEIEDIYTYTVASDGATIQGVIKTVSGDVTVPAMLGGYPVVSIGNYAFSSCSNITSVVIPEGVKSIGYQAFYSCTALTSVTMPASVARIDGQVFGQCPMLEELLVDENNTVYHSSGNCIIHTETKELTVGCRTSVIPEDGSVTAIKAYAFYECDTLMSITLPDTITIIGTSAFKGCNALMSVVMSSKVGYIGKSAFSSCYSLHSITIPKGVKNIESATFSRCYSLKSVALPEGVKSIGVNAFLGCKALKTVMLPRSVTAIDDCAFDQCPALSLMIYAGDESERNVVSGIGALRTRDIKWCYRAVVEGDYVYTVSEGEATVLATLEKKSYVDVPTTLGGYPVTGIGDKAFCNDTTLKAVRIPLGVKRIGKDAFAGCTALNDVWFNGAEAERNAISFGSNELFSLTWRLNTCTTHAYQSECDAECDACKWNRTAPHVYVSDCDNLCNLCGAKRSGTALHVFRPACATVCAACGQKRATVRGHVYTSRCDTTCNVCNKTRETAAKHTYSFFCDSTCDACSAVRGDASAHTFDNDEDATCNVCGFDRSIGDVNGDGRVDSTDARLVLQYAVNKIPATALKLAAADVDASGTIDSTDARLILQYAVKKIGQWPTA